MLNNDFKSQLRQRSIPKPYCSVGAGPLTSFVWKSGHEESGWRYQFNLFRLAADGGRVSQLFTPSDLMHFVKLAQVLATVITDDGCLSPVDRGVLKRLAADLDEMLTRAAKPSTNDANTSADSDLFQTTMPKNSEGGNHADTTDS